MVVLVQQLSADGGAKRAAVKNAAPKSVVVNGAAARVTMVKGAAAKGTMAKGAVKGTMAKGAAKGTMVKGAVAKGAVVNSGANSGVNSGAMVSVFKERRRVSRALGGETKSARALGGKNGQLASKSKNVVGGLPRLGGKENIGGNENVPKRLSSNKIKPVAGAVKRKSR
jgi:hypothetical protein